VSINAEVNSTPNNDDDDDDDNELLKEHGHLLYHPFILLYKDLQKKVHRLLMKDKYNNIATCLPSVTHQIDYILHI
jgi:hypothetical protein